MRIWKMLGLGFLIATLWVTPGWTQPGGRMHGDVLGFGPLLRALSLTDSQKTQVHNAFANYRNTVRSLWGQVRATRQQLTDILVNPNTPDPSTLQSATHQLASLQDQLLQARLDLAQAIRDVLTMDQLTQAKQLKDELRALRTNMHQLLEPPAQQ
jgi:Spy/CpxP family protein refolding chaperone